MMSHIKVHSSTPYHILLAKFGEPPKGLCALKLVVGFQQWLTHLSLSWLVNQATLLSQHPTQNDKHVEGIIESMTLGNP
jgi:hypothetical protein